MNAMKWMKWFCIGLLATGCTLTTGCGGDDDNSDSTDGGGTAVTNALNPPGGVGTIVTNVVLVHSTF